LIKVNLGSGLPEMTTSGRLNAGGSGVLKGKVELRIRKKSGFTDPQTSAEPRLPGLSHGGQPAARPPPPLQAALPAGLRHHRGAAAAPDGLALLLAAPGFWRQIQSLIAAFPA